MTSRLVKNWVEYLETTRKETWFQFIVPVQKILQEEMLDAPAKLNRLEEINREFLKSVQGWYFNLEDHE